MAKDSKSAADLDRYKNKVVKDTHEDLKAKKERLKEEKLQAIKQAIEEFNRLSTFKEGDEDLVDKETLAILTCMKDKVEPIEVRKNI